MSSWYFEPILDSFAMVTTMIVVLLALLFFGPRYKGLTLRKRAILTALRVVLIGLLAVAMLRPTYVSTRSEPQTATLLILVDQSRSLSVSDSSDGQTRWQIIQSTIRSVSDRINELTKTFDVKALTFDLSVANREIKNGLISIPEKPVGNETDIGAAIENVVQGEIGKRVAGVILISDGAQRVLQAKVDIQQAVRNMARLGYPLYAVTVGRTRDLTQSRDVAVQNVQDQYTVFVKNQLLLQGSLVVHGYANKSIDVELRMQAPDGNSQVVAKQSINTTIENNQSAFEFSFTPDQVGQYKLDVVAETQPGELVTDNNQLTSFVNVLDGGIRILFINGNVLSSDQRILRQSIGSSPDIQLDEKRVDYRLHRDHPIDLSRELDEKYDVIILSDIHAEILGEENSKKIVEKVESGCGFLMTGGIYSFGPGGYEKNPIAKLLPIEIGRFEKQDIGPETEIRKNLHLEGPLVMVPNRRHFITRIAPLQENEAAWKKLAALTGANLLGQVKPEAGVLATTENGQPILVAGQYVDGRVLAFAAHSTYRWWTYGRSAEHKRFWRQVMLWLAKKDEFQNQDVWIRLEKRRFLPGERISFSAGARDADGSPLSDAVVRADLVFPNGDRQPIRVNPSNEGWFGAYEEVLETGEYRIEVKATSSLTEIGENASRFIVMRQDLELSDPSANPEQMRLLSSLTSKAGGRAITPEQLPQLLDEIKNSPQEMDVEVQSKWQFGDTPADTWPFFLVAITVLSVEWFLRKRWGMV